MNNENSTADPILIADIGGTNARFALARAGRIWGEVTVLACRDHADLAAATSVFLDSVSEIARPRSAVIAVASPISGDRVQFTNLDWAFSTDQLRRELRLDALDIVNDFAAITWAVPGFGDRDLSPVGGGTACADAPIVVMGPGSGLGVAMMVPVAGGWLVLPTEGGHVTMAAATAEQDRVLNVLRHKFGHVSAERVLSGSGLVNIYTALGDLDGQALSPLRPDAISALAVSEPGSRAAAALDLFFDFLGTAASNAALSCDARGGVYLAGGILGKVEAALGASGFRARFEAKGRFMEYLSHIPTLVIRHPYPALAGLARGSPTPQAVKGR
jgi:glucokinase